jgi:hypothetical protein
MFYLMHGCLAQSDGSIAESFAATNRAPEPLEVCQNPPEHIDS